MAGDIAEWTSAADHDLVLSNAALQWVADHPAVLKRWSAALAPGGQLAVQVPANAYMPSHTVAQRLAEAEPYRRAFGPHGPPTDPVADNVLAPEAYATLLHDLGFERQHVRLQVYPHVLPSTAHIVEWIKGTSLTRFEKRLPAELYARFLTEYEEALIAELGNNEPQFFPFRRILLWAQRAR